MNSSPPGSSVHGISQARNRSGLPFPSPRFFSFEVRSQASFFFFFFQMATEFTQYYLLKICFHLDHIWHFYKWGHFSPLNSIQCNLSNLVLFITSALIQTLIALIPSSWTSAFPWFLWKIPLLSFHMNFRIKFWKFCLRYYYYTVFTDYILWTSRYLQYETKTTL